MKFKMIHENYNVQDLERSFYEQASVSRNAGARFTPDGSFIIVYIGNAHLRRILKWNLRRRPRWPASAQS